MVFSAASRLLGLAWALEASASCPVHGSQLLQLKEERREVPLQLDQRYFHLHIPKTADEVVTSFLRYSKSLSEICRKDLIEGPCRDCWLHHSEDPKYLCQGEKVIAVLRSPRAHIISLFQECKAQPHRGTWELGAWLQHWALKARRGELAPVRDRTSTVADHGPYKDCYIPYNFQSSYLKIINATPSFLAIADLLDLSGCVFAARLLGHVPAMCSHCTHRGYSDPDNSYKAELNKSDIEHIQGLTEMDESIFWKSYKELVEEAQRLEKRFGRRLICPGELSRVLRHENATHFDHRAKQHKEFDT